MSSSFIVPEIEGGQNSYCIVNHCKSYFLERTGGKLRLELHLLKMSIIIIIKCSKLPSYAVFSSSIVDGKILLQQNVTLPLLLSLLHSASLGISKSD